MESIYRPIRQVKIPLTIDVADFMRDHRYEGRVILPAVEALQILARLLPADSHSCGCFLQEGGSFAHPLFLEPEAATLSVYYEIDLLPDGGRRYRLMTLRSGRQTKVVRSVEHASVLFPSIGSRLAGRGELSLQDSTDNKGLKGATFIFSSRRLYDDLVPFGPAYHNVVGDVVLTGEGASASLSGGHYREAVGPLGSPFPFDAAMHVACAWGQRYHGTVAFPIGFSRREILVPTQAGERYSCRIIPLPGSGPVLSFHIFIYGSDHRIVEVIRRLEMRDLSRGRLAPPDWVREGI
jgi:hypothetical protein